MKKLIFLFLIISSLTSCSQSDNDLSAQLDQYFTKEFNAGNFNGNLLIADKGKIVLSKSYGLADWKTNRPLNTESIFELASLSKQFTAMGIMILENRGKLSYSDTLRKFFPELPYNNITVRQLLNHVSGLPDYMDLFEVQWDRKKIATNADMISMLAKHSPPIHFTPGTKWEYCNTGYVLLASIIEKVSEKPFAEFMRTNIFQPLGMKRTSIFSRRFEKRELDNYAYGHVLNKEYNYVLADSVKEIGWMLYTLDGIQGDGTVNSTVNDLFIWDRALRENKLVSPAAMKQAFTPATLPGNVKTYYGFGWGIEENKTFGKITSHTGGWPGYMTFIERHLDNDKTIIVLQNNGRPLPKFTDIRNMLYGIKKVEPKAAKTSAEELKDYPGTYQLAPDFDLVITVNDDKIFVQATGQGKIEMVKENTDIFFCKGVDASLKFSRDDKGKVTSVTLLQNGNELPGPKIK